MRLHIQTNHRQKYPRHRAARSSARFGRLFPHTLPILAGFLFLGFAYGLLMRTKGFSFLYPMCMAMTIFGGSLEYVTVSMLLSAFAPLETFLMALLIQARHPFYGAVSAGQVRRDRLEEAAAHLWPVRRNLLHHLLRRRAAGGDRGWCYLWVTVLDWCYWGAGAAVLLHIWRRQMLLSIAGGTIVYMLLVQMM